MDQGTKGVYPARKKDGSVHYRTSITFHGKHISLGSFPDPALAGRVYQEGKAVLAGSARPEDYPTAASIPFDKWICLVNFRDNGVYFANPIYLRPRFFRYYLEPEDFFLFDIEDLFYYSSHRISRRGGHYFVADYGSQITLKSRYGIRPFAVFGRDYRFRNDDDHDYRYGNLEIINRYNGVRKISKNGRDQFKAVIHVNGDFVIGTYDTELEAAIAYNKAADQLIKLGSKKKYVQNDPECSPKDYSEIYVGVKISEKLNALRFT